MSNERAVIIYWGGELIQTANGANVQRAKSRIVNFSDDFDLDWLHRIIRNAVGIREDGIITKILFRHPVMGFGVNVVSGFMQIRDNFDVFNMFQMVRQYSGCLTIELNIQFSSATFRHERYAEASSSRYIQNEINVEQEIGRAHV